MSFKELETQDLESMLAAATPGPWETHPDLPKASVNLDMGFAVLMVLDEGSPGPENGRLAASAPEAVAEVVRLRKELKGLQKHMRYQPNNILADEVASAIRIILEGDKS